MARSNTHKPSIEQSKLAARWLANLKSGTAAERKAKLSKEAKRIAAKEGIEYKSARRRLERYTTETGTQRRDLLKSPKVGRVVDRAPVQLFKPGEVEICGKVQYSEDVRRRCVIFALRAVEMKRLLACNSEGEMAAYVGSIKRFQNFEFKSIDSVRILDRE